MMGSFDNLAKWVSMDRKIDGIIEDNVTEIRNKRFFSGLKKTMSVDLLSVGEFGVDAPIIGTKKSKIFHLMDALGAYYECAWEKQSLGVYSLLSGESENEAAYSGHTSSLKKMNEVGANFIEEFENGNNQIKQKLTSVNGCKFDDINPKMKDDIKKMIYFLREHFESEGRNNYFDKGLEDNLSGRGINVKKENKDGFDILKISIEGTGTTFSVNNYTSNKNKFDMRKTGWSGVKIDFEKFAIKKEKIMLDEVMNRKISVNVESKYAYTPMKEIYNLAGIPFICDASSVWTQRSSLRLSNTPVWKVLDELTNAYLLTEWEFRPSGFILLRGPFHPRRTRQKNEVELMQRIPRPRPK